MQGTSPQLSLEYPVVNKEINYYKSGVFQFKYFQYIKYGMDEPN